jgi:hypothetical protein
VEVIVAGLEVYDRADERSYITGQLRQGDRVRVRDRVAGGWLAIEPPPATIGWVERAALDWDAEQPEGTDGDPFDRFGSRSGPPARARVVVPRAVVRSGHPRARIPGPPWVELARGTMLQLVDRLPLAVGRGATATLWFAIVPPAGAVCYIRVEGTRGLAPPRAPGSETLAAYGIEEPEDARSEAGTISTASLPAEVAAEIGRIESMHLAILASRPIEQWRLDPVRAGYQALLKRAGDDPAVEEALRERLARVTRHEQAAQAARTFQKVLERSRRRDLQVAQVPQRLAAADRASARAYRAIGFVQPSSRTVEGRKLYALIGSTGSTLAYLDIPPGIDLDSLMSRRVGVRGSAHFNQDLGTRLITVRDLEAVEARR